ncbi:hypothetical protein TgHK011_009342 [Trichoderma gracile]|nr:hypothetical protein TgHK011_009342 [Trichoderma gracile]
MEIRLLFPGGHKNASREHRSYASGPTTVTRLWAWCATTSQSGANLPFTLSPRNSIPDESVPPSLVWYGSITCSIAKPLAKRPSITHSGVVPVRPHVITAAIGTRSPTPELPLWCGEMGVCYSHSSSSTTLALTPRAPQPLPIRYRDDLRVVVVVARSLNAL